MYPIVVLRKVNSRTREDHLTFITVDKKHEVPFVELCNECLHAFYKEDGINITHDVEYNDGCASQFKCTDAFSSMARRSIKTTLIFLKLAMANVNRMDLEVSLRLCFPKYVWRETIIRNGKELYDFLFERMVVNNAYDSTKAMFSRTFYFSSEESEKYHSAFHSVDYKYSPGTL